MRESPVQSEFVIALPTHTQRNKEEETSLSAARATAFLFVGHSPFPNGPAGHQGPRALSHQLHWTGTRTQLLATLVTPQLVSNLPPLSSTPLKATLAREDTTLQTTPFDTRGYLASLPRSSQKHPVRWRWPRSSPGRSRVASAAADGARGRLLQEPSCPAGWGDAAPAARGAGEEARARKGRALRPAGAARSTLCDASRGDRTSVGGDASARLTCVQYVLQNTGTDLSVSRNQDLSH